MSNIFVMAGLVASTLVGCASYKGPAQVPAPAPVPAQVAQVPAQVAQVPAQAPVQAPLKDNDKITVGKNGKNYINLTPFTEYVDKWSTGGYENWNGAIFSDSYTRLLDSVVTR